MEGECVARDRGRIAVVGWSVYGGLQCVYLYARVYICTELSALCVLGDHDINIASCHAVIRMKLAIVRDTQTDTCIFHENSNETPMTILSFISSTFVSLFFFHFYRKKYNAIISRYEHAINNKMRICV